MAEVSRAMGRWTSDARFAAGALTPQRYARRIQRLAVGLPVRASVQFTNSHMAALILQMLTRFREDSVSVARVGAAHVFLIFLQYSFTQALIIAATVQSPGQNQFNQGTTAGGVIY